jgi:hypothetical protein
MAIIPLLNLSEMLHRSARVLGLTLAVVSAALALPAIADNGSRFSVSGFGTVGAVRTSSDDVEFVRDISQPRGARSQWNGRVDSVFGLQASWRMTPEFEAVVQGVSRYRYDRTFTPEIAWAYLKYEPNPALSLRFGRLGTEFFMLADSRMVGYSYLTVRPPGDYFWYLPFFSVNGADAALTVPLGDNMLHGKIYYGIADGKIPLADRQWKIDGSPLMGAYLEYQTGAWVLRGSYANIRFNSSLPIADQFYAVLPPALARASLDYIETDGTRSHYYSLGLVYDSGPWQLQLMLNSVDQGSRAFENSRAGYVLAGYRIGSVTPYLGYSRVDSTRRGTTAHPGVARVQADSRTQQGTVIVGARWDVMRNLAFKAQWDAIRGDPSSIFPYRRETADWDGRLDVFSLTMDFVF